MKKLKIIKYRLKFLIYRIKSIFKKPREQDTFIYEYDDETYS